MRLPHTAGAVFAMTNAKAKRKRVWAIEDGIAAQ